MDNKKLEAWTRKLLDTGKGNNAINFKDTRSSTAEVVFPDAEALYEKCLKGSNFEIYDPKLKEPEDDMPETALAAETSSGDIMPLDGGQDAADPEAKKAAYIEEYSKKIKKSSQILIYSENANPITAVKNVEKKARSFQEETGLSVSYMAFGFVYWRENETSVKVLRAPLLLMPVSIRNESAITPVFLDPLEDEVFINTAFSYLLKAEYGITLPDLEEDESLQSYLEKVRALVLPLRWEVVSECKIGIFSFAKINMYHDLVDNAEKILENRNIRLLLGENIPESDALDMPAEGTDTQFHMVVDADASQMEAIEMAKSGKSFVLQGPPGTGKSQTITNIIAECLYDGRKVLFVSEKIAALNVVYDKLKKNGLEEFCLELHSHKANKKDVISELCKTLKTEKTAVSKRADAEVKAMEEYRLKLDQYAEELHKSVPVIKKSLFGLYNAFYSFRDIPEPEEECVLRDISSKGGEYTIISLPSVITRSGRRSCTLLVMFLLHPSRLLHRG